MTIMTIGMRVQPIAGTILAEILGGQLKGTVVAVVDQNGVICSAPGASELNNYRQSVWLLDEPDEFCWLVDEGQGSRWDGRVHYGDSPDFEEVSEE